MSGKNIKIVIDKLQQESKWEKNFSKDKGQPFRSSLTHTHKSNGLKKPCQGFEKK